MAKNPRAQRKVFFNYRRSDNPDFVERIRDWFIRSYGRENVFMDFDNIPPFARFSDFIRERVRQCDVLIAIIGPAWVDMLQQRMSSGEEDYVRMEIVTALNEGKLIAPLCIKGASVPLDRDLPADLRPMLQQNVAFLDSGAAFLDNIESIMDAVEDELVRREIDSVVRPMETLSTPEFDLSGAIVHFYEAVDAKDWQAALDWLKRIRSSDQTPRFFRLDEYEHEILEEIRSATVERDYAILRMMARRADKGLESRARMWEALQIFMETYPGYDPDDLASRFGPKPLEEPLATLTPIQGFDPRVLDQLASVDTAAAEALFAPDKVASIAQDQGGKDTLSYDEARKQGIMP